MAKFQFDQPLEINPADVFKRLRSAVRETEPGHRTLEQTFVLGFVDALESDTGLRDQILARIERDVKIAPTIGPSPDKCPTCGRKL